MTTANVSATERNPLLDIWSDPRGIPPFEAIAAEHYRPAFDVALARQRAEIDAIAGDTRTADFRQHHRGAGDEAARTLKKVGGVFFNLSGSHTNDAMQAVEREMAPRSRQAPQRNLHERDAVPRASSNYTPQRDSLGLTPEQARVLERYHTIFVRAGAKLGPRRRSAAGGDHRAPGEPRHAILARTFWRTRNPIGSFSTAKPISRGFRPSCAKRGAGGRRCAACRASTSSPCRGRASSRSCNSRQRRDLREQAFRAWTARGDSGGATDNKAIIAEMVALRAERAKLLGYETFADFKLADTMAKTPDAVLALLE